VRYLTVQAGLAFVTAHLDDLAMRVDALSARMRCLVLIRPNEANQAYCLYSVAIATSSGSQVIARRAASAKGPNDQGNYRMWQGRSLVQQGAFQDALKSFKVARQLFSEAKFPLNAAWAGLWEARVLLSLSERREFFARSGAG
jgi:hypothetical protein